jgi:predicted nucleic acid-binding protein
VLGREKFATRLARANRTAATLIEQYTGLAETINPASIAPTVLADPEDDHVLACALAAGADLIVSGDAHLRNLKSYQSMSIMNASAALALITKR